MEAHLIRENGFPRARRATQDVNSAAEEATAENLVEARNARSNTSQTFFVGRFLFAHVR
jgi:hypothetical protein